MRRVLDEMALGTPQIPIVSNVDGELYPTGDVERVKDRLSRQLASPVQFVKGLETLYREVTLRQGLRHTFEDMMREIQRLIEQMTDEERRQYLSESLFLNTVTYENDKLGQFIKKLPTDA